MESLPFSRTSSFREMFCSSPAVSVIVLCFKPPPPPTSDTLCHWLHSSSQGHSLSFSCGIFPLPTHTLSPACGFLPLPGDSCHFLVAFFLFPHTLSLIFLWLSSSSLTLCHLRVAAISSSSPPHTLCHPPVAFLFFTHSLSSTCGFFLFPHSLSSCCGFIPLLTDTLCHFPVTALFPRTLCHLPASFFVFPRTPSAMSLQEKYSLGLRIPSSDLEQIPSSFCDHRLPSSALTV